MPKVVLLTCLSPRARMVARTEIGKIDNPQVVLLFEEILNTVADCEGGEVIGFSVQETEGEAVSTVRSRRKRALSKYNLFIRDCAQGGAKTLRECATLWRTSPENPKNQPGRQNAEARR